MKIDKIEYPRIVKLYNDGFSATEISDSYYVHKTTIQIILNKLNIKMRSPSERARKYSFNENFFEKIDTEQKAYWLGFIIADGCISCNKYSKTLQIALNKIDFLHLKKFLRSVNSNVPIKSGCNNSVICCLTSYKLGNDLSQYGVVPRKAHKTYFPKQIPEYLQRHFIRGVFDGDGCLACNRNLKSWYFNITGNRKLLLSIQRKLIKDLNLSKTKLSKGTTYCLRYGGNRQVNKILNYLYRDSTVYLDRKYNIYKDFSLKYDHAQK